MNLHISRINVTVGLDSRPVIILILPNHGDDSLSTRAAIIKTITMDRSVRREPYVLDEYNSAWRTVIATIIDDVVL